MKHTIHSLILCTLVWLLSPVSHAALSRDDLFLAYTRANQNFAQANAQPDAARARTLYEQSILDYENIIAEGGVRNARLFYNLANAYLLTDDLGRAVLNYRRALELDGSNPDILKNLSYARARQVDRIAANPQKKVLERLFFWHYDFSMRTRFVVGGIGFALLCVYLSMRLWFARLPRLVPLCVILALTAAVMAASVSMESLHRARYRSGVITALEVTARQGDGPNYPPSFSQPLHAGLEFELVERRPDWLHIELANGQRTWIPVTGADLI
jgi:multisubunit Na+/H+ antiporter MnhG subunit